MKAWVLRLVIPILMAAGVSAGGQGNASPGSPESAVRGAENLPERQSPQAAVLAQAAFDPVAGAAVPLDLPFRNEAGRTVTLSALASGKPLILVLAYYRCPMLCKAVLDGLAQGLGAVAFQPGRDYAVAVVSIDSSEGPALASAKKQDILARVGRDSGAVAGWHFLTGPGPSIEAVAEAVGFRYAYDASLREFAHAAGLTVLTPGGRISRALPGLEYEPRTLRLALAEASRGNIGTWTDKLLLACYRFDPNLGRYTPAVNAALRAGALLTALSLVGGIFLGLRRERRRTGAKAHA